MAVRSRRAFGLMLAMLLAPWLAVAAAHAGEPTPFQAAFDQASAQYQAALAAVGTADREQASAEVYRFRLAWQAVADRFALDRPVGLAGDHEIGGLFVQVDALVVGALIVIDIGTRDAARGALAPIADVLSQIEARSGPAR